MRLGIVVADVMRRRQPFVQRMPVKCTTPPEREGNLSDSNRKVELADPAGPSHSRCVGYPGFFGCILRRHKIMHSEAAEKHGQGPIMGLWQVVDALTGSCCRLPLSQCHL